MPAFRRRRLYAFALFILVVGSIFLCFQFFSIRVLDSYSGAGSDVEHRLGRGAMPRVSNLEGGKYVQDSGKVRKSDKPVEKLIVPELMPDADCTANCSDAQRRGKLEKGLNTTFKSRLIVDGRNKFKSSSNSDKVKLPGIPTTFDSWTSLEKYYSLTQSKVADSSSDVLPCRGVPAWWKHLYEETTAEKLFVCLFSRETIPINRVNDDYCDCKDSTDEPGTSACPDSRFYCSFQSSAKSKWLPPSRINDGLCDCCDGSDEWTGTVVPERNRIANSRPHYGLHQAPCIDRCADLRSAEANLLALRDQGAVLKLDYVKEGSKQHNPNMIYGMDAEFYPLSQKCWSLTISKYTYSVCPFGPIKQTANGVAELVIGKVASWSAYEQGVDLRLSVIDGDSRNCPDMKRRSTLIIFRCALEDKVDRLSESETCVYTIYFSTPAAC